MNLTPPDKDTSMTLQYAQHLPEHGNRGEEDLLAILRKGGDSAQRLSLHTCLLERRLRGGAESADLLVLVQDLRFIGEELQNLLRSAVQTMAATSNDARDAVKGGSTTTPLRVEVVDLRSLLTHCVDSVRQRVRSRGVPLLCDIALDLPFLTTNPEMLARVFSFLLEHVVRTSGKGGLEVRVRWTESVLAIDVYDAGRGISAETYKSLLNMVDMLQGTLRVSHELGRRSCVEISFPPATTQGNGRPQVASANTRVKELGK
jgi:signal transduction histidine kinase